MFSIQAVRALCGFAPLLITYLYRAIAEESLKREIFEEYVAHLQEKAKEKERKREEEKVQASYFSFLIMFLLFLKVS